MMNFTKSEIDTVIVRRFAQKTNFAAQIDSLILDSLNCQIIFYPYDSIPVYSIFGFVNNSFNIVPGYDYEIFVPATNTLETINNILQPQTQQKVCSGASHTETGCTNSITSLDVNGILQKNTTVIYVNK